MRWVGQGAPADDVVSVNTEAEEIGRNETRLFGPEPDKANDDAISRGYHPSLPVMLSDEHGRADCQSTRDVIKTHERFRSNNVYLNSRGKNIRYKS